MSELIASGVDGLFLKRGDPTTLFRGLQLVTEGGKFVAPDVVALLGERPPGPDLTMRERQTLSLVAQGLTNAEIAARLHISPKTVDKHRTSLMAKLDVHSMSELLAHALREGLLDASTMD
ncbi:MAG: response regulator transcription factor [Pseudomonadota bacterium]